MGKRTGRPAHRPEYEPTDDDRALVERLSALRVTHEEIAKTWIKPPISAPTLRKHFREELDHGAARTCNRLKALALRHAENGSLRAIFELLDRMEPSFAKPRVGLFADGTVPQGTTVIIKGGPPDDDLPVKPNGHGHGNGHVADIDATDPDC